MLTWVLLYLYIGQSVTVALCCYRDTGDVLTAIAAAIMTPILVPVSIIYTIIKGKI